ncbi:hypothetical protein CEUSTIGMA_g4208.t1 [Chlamydomonas eustigma]|uniref:Major facilitator superfamily (MFS) profile domain-containing protein n=1 Tax=Chlamydomonas eustigma TaxID=1157962 RepID=A0A250X0Z6_9CHLO|nr:hypothetical protein CEUSTIGMA_g4208.t1 [Chlamydomonas eustigma]|eukprot:GAX76761.1 hypothetical protein CEUSTIGMA_g4208.t1 [Chlamydomonas eustigma]
MKTLKLSTSCTKAYSNLGIFCQYSSYCCRYVTVIQHKRISAKFHSSSKTQPDRSVQKGIRLRRATSGNDLRYSSITGTAECTSHSPCLLKGREGYLVKKDELIAASSPPYTLANRHAPVKEASVVRGKAGDIPGPRDRPPSDDSNNRTAEVFPPVMSVSALILLSVSYVHMATASCALPAMLPSISTDLHLDNLQGALLTTGYSYLYALSLVPIGMLADRLPRNHLMAAGLATWSTLTLLASGAKNFGELLATRAGFAMAQAVQNPISFALIPELFPQNKSAALAIYNCAIYVGRALSFGAVIAADNLGHRGSPGVIMTQAEAATSAIFLVPLEKLDLQLVSIVYTRGDYAAVMPNYSYYNPAEAAAAAAAAAASAAGPLVSSAAETVVQEVGGTWRDVLPWIAIPGFIISLLLFFALPEPRNGVGVGSGGGVSAAVLRKSGPTAESCSSGQSAMPTVLDRDLVQSPRAPPSTQEMIAGFSELLQSPAFLTTSFAASLNDVGSYALIAWQSTFYEHVFHLEPSVYAATLAAVLPLGGIVGGVTGGWAADRLGPGRRLWVTGACTALAAPLMLLSLIAGSPDQSFLALLGGFTLSEAWRAPAAVMARSVAPASMGSSSTALYLCIRNFVGGFGPLGVALLTDHFGGDLRSAMLLVPAAYLASGVLFAVAEGKHEDWWALQRSRALLSSGTGSTEGGAFRSGVGT